MKKLLALFFIIFLSCQVYIVSKEYVEIESLVEEYSIELGDPYDFNITEYYDDGTERKRIYYWEIYEEYYDQYNRVHYYTILYVVFWNNIEIERTDWNYGWNILDESKLVGGR